MFDINNLPLFGDKLLFIGGLTSKYITYILGIQFFLILVLFILNKKEILSQFKKISKRTWLLLSLIFLFALFLRLRHNGCDSLDRLLLEYVFASEEMLKGEPISDLWHPRGYSFILTILFLIFGMHYNVVLYYNILISGFLTVLTFLLAYILFKDESIGLFAALILSLLPTSIFYTQILSSNITSVFFVTLSILIFLISLPLDKPKLYCLSALLFTYSFQIRADNIMFLGLLFFGITYYKYKRKIHLKNLKLAMILFIVFLIPMSYFYLHGDVLFGSYNDPFHEQRPLTFSLAYLKTNLTYYFSRLAMPGNYPTILYIFLFIPIILVKGGGKNLFLIVWIIIFLIFYGAYWYSDTNDPDLYQLLLHPPMVILMASGLNKTKNFIENLLKIKSSLLKNILLILMILLIFKTFHYYSKEFYKQDVPMFCESKNILKLSKVIEKNSCIVVESTINEYTSKPFECIAKFLLPKFQITTSIEECENKAYYLSIKSEKFDRLFKNQQNIINNIKKSGYKLNLVNKIENEFEFVGIYEIT